jgi:hypothetical protein
MNMNTNWITDDFENGSHCHRTHVCKQHLVRGKRLSVLMSFISAAYFWWHFTCWQTAGTVCSRNSSLSAAWQQQRKQHHTHHMHITEWSVVNDINTYYDCRMNLDCSKVISDVHFIIGCATTSSRTASCIWRHDYVWRVALKIVIES